MREDIIEIVQSTMDWLAVSYLVLSIPVGNFLISIGVSLTFYIFKKRHFDSLDILSAHLISEFPNIS
jgi:peptidoglycan biosynthesis protein MviN/MurJ (putative lipid II flippase)